MEGMDGLNVEGKADDTYLQWSVPFRPQCRTRHLSRIWYPELIRDMWAEPRP